MDMTFPSFSRWENPTDKVVRLDVCVKANAEKGDGRMKIEVLPKGSKVTEEHRKRGTHESDKDGLVICARLPAELDAAIHIIRDGVIVGGLAPQLRKLDADEEVTLAPELDSLETAKKESLEKATMAMAAKVAAESDLITSAAKVAEVSEQQAKQSGKGKGGG